MSPEPVEHFLRIDKTARYYRRGEPHAATREVWIACHGYGQLAAHFIRALEPLAAPDRVIVAPEGLHRFYLEPPDRPASSRRVGATWMTREDREHDIADYVGYLDRLGRDLRTQAPGARIVALGFSQGGATAARWATFGATAIARLVLWGSALPPDLDWSRATERLRGIPLTLVIGERDHYVTPERTAEEERRLADHGVAFDVVRYPGGHALDGDTLKRVAGVA
jgi:predicted esterase